MSFLLHSRVLNDAVGLERGHEDVDEPQEEEEEAAGVSARGRASELSSHERSSGDQHDVADDGHAEEHNDGEGQGSALDLIPFGIYVIGPID